MTDREPVTKELTDIEKTRRWSAAIAKAIESFKQRDGALVKVSK